MKTCTECDKPARARGLCERHYHRARRAGLLAAKDADIRDRLGDLEWLLDGGVWPPQAAERCGWSVAAAEKAAPRRGFQRVSRILMAHVAAERRVA